MLADGMLTVEENSRVDAAAIDRVREIPHLAERPTLAQRDRDADDHEDDVEGNRRKAEPAQCPRGSCSSQLRSSSMVATAWMRQRNRTDSEVHAQDGDLNEADSHVVHDLDSQRDFHEIDHVVQSERPHGMPEAVLLAHHKCSQIAAAESLRQTRQLFSASACHRGSDDQRKTYHRRKYGVVIIARIAQKTNSNDGAEKDNQHCRPSAFLVGSTTASRKALTC